MAEAPSIPGGESHENGDLNGRDHELFLPIANVIRIIKNGLPADAQIAKDAKEAVQDCVSVFVSFITSEAGDCCREDKRQTLNGDDVLYAMKTLGFEDYVGPLKAYLKKYRESEGNHVQSIKDHDGSVRKEGVQLQPHQGNSQSQGNHVQSIKDHDGSVRKEGVQLQPHQGNSQSQGDYVRSIKDHNGSVRKEGVQLQPHQGNSQSQLQGDYVRSIKDHDGSVRKEGVQLQPHEGNSESQSQGDYVRSIKDHDGSVRKEGVQLQPHEGNSESQSQGDYVRSIKDHDGSVRKEGVQLQPHEGNSESQSQNTIGKTQGEGDVEAVDETKHIMMDLKESGYTAKEIAAALCDDEWIRSLVNFE